MKKFTEIMDSLKERNRNLKLITHDGVCHTDDCACAALLSVLADKCGVKTDVLRTRNETMLSWHKGMEDDGIIIFDVGGGEFDHHKKDEIVDGRPLSSIGKIWRWVKEDVKELYSLDDISWVEIDRQLIAPIDRTDNIGDMNPLNFSINCIRTICGAPTQEAFEQCMKQMQIVFSTVLRAEALLLGQRKDFDDLPVEEIEGRKFKINREEGKYIPAGQVDEDIFGYIWKASNTWKFKTFNGNSVKPGIDSYDNVDGVIFTHKGGWTGEIKSLEDLKKILPVE